MTTATKIGPVNPSANGNQVLWKLSEPVGYDHDWKTNEPAGVTGYVITSAVVAMFTGPETYIFPADADGNVIDWGEMEGSLRGTLSHEAAILSAGWEIA